jgi:ornithine decarboxylase
VVGVSFHVGSAATNPAAFEEAIEMADRAFAQGGAHGHALNLLDIGGGFSSQCFSQWGGRDIPAAVKRALETHFPESRGVRIISEPGR